MFLEYLTHKNDVAVFLSSHLYLHCILNMQKVPCQINLGCIKESLLINLGDERTHQKLANASPVVIHSELKP